MSLKMILRGQIYENITKLMPQATNYKTKNTQNMIYLKNIAARGIFFHRRFSQFNLIDYFCLRKCCAGGPALIRAVAIASKGNNKTKEYA